MACFDRSVFTAAKYFNKLLSCPYRLLRIIIEAETFKVLSVRIDRPPNFSFKQPGRLFENFITLRFLYLGEDTTWICSPFIGSSRTS